MQIFPPLSNKLAPTLNAERWTLNAQRCANCKHLPQTELWLWCEFRPEVLLPCRENAQLLSVHTPSRIKNVKSMSFFYFISYLSLNSKDFVWYHLTNTEVVSEYFLPLWREMPLSSASGWRQDFWTPCTTNILIPLEQAIFSRGRAPHEKRLVVHLDNCCVHTGRVSTDWLEEHNILRTPHSRYSPDLASSDFYLFPTVKDKLERI
jgi:hypothetical protein